jgi:LysM repeat protein
LARHEFPPRPGLRWTARLTAVVVGAAVVSTSLALPAVAATVHVVKRGESLSRIAAGAGLQSWRQLHDANPSVANPNVIRVGQRLVIPEADALSSSRATGKRATPKAKPAVKKKAVIKKAVFKKKVRKKVAIPTKRTLRKIKPRKKHHIVAKRTHRHRTTKVAPRGVWDRLAKCESGGNWHINTGNGYSGGLQFSHATWRAYGGSGRAYQASRSHQIRIAEKIKANQGWGAWPACSRKLGLR